MAIVIDAGDTLANLGRDLTTAADAVSVHH